MGKSSQAARYAPTAGEGDGTAGATPAAPSVPRDVDVSYHTSAWHEARIASLTSNRMTWDEFRKQQREIQAKEDALVGSEKAMREHRALLDAERAARLSSRAAAAAPPKKRKSKSKDRDKKKRKKSKDKKSKKSKSKSKDKGKKRRRSSSSSSGSDSSGSGSDSGSSSDSGGSGSDGERERGEKRRKSEGEKGGPVKLSEYLYG